MKRAGPNWRTADGPAVDGAAQPRPNPIPCRPPYGIPYVVCVVTMGTDGTPVYSVPRVFHSYRRAREWFEGIDGAWARWVVSPYGIELGEDDYLFHVETLATLLAETARRARTAPGIRERRFARRDLSALEFPCVEAEWRFLRPGEAMPGFPPDPRLPDDAGPPPDPAELPPLLDYPEEWPGVDAVEPLPVEIQDVPDIEIPDVPQGSLFRGR